MVQHVETGQRHHKQSIFEPESASANALCFFLPATSGTPFLAAPNLLS